MKRTSKLVLVGNLVCFAVSAQIPVGYNADNESFGMQPMLQYAFQQLNSKSLNSLGAKVNYKGSPFVIRTFVKGRIFSNDGYEGEAYLRHDGYNDEIQLKSSVQDSLILKLVQNDSIYCFLGNDKVLYREFYDKKGELHRGHLYQLIETDTMVLFERRNKIYKEGKAATTSFELPVANRFILERELYVLDKEEQKINYFKASKKKILELFSNEKQKAQSIKGFLSKNRLSYKDPKDVKRVFSYYNTL
ncbi:MAG: hypothetical protein AAGH46_13710, partial [Bacteroidota bacterium]